MDVKTLCLGVLSRGNYSGYEIRKQFEDGSFSRFQEAGFGSIYPALRRLTEEGLVTCSEMQQENRPDKKVYQITSRGREELFEAVNRFPGPDKLRSDFAFVLVFADLLPPRHLDRLFADRIAEHREAAEAAKVKQGRATAPGEAFVLKYVETINTVAANYLEDHHHELIGALFRREVAE